MAGVVSNLSRLTSESVFLTATMSCISSSLLLLLLQIPMDSPIRLHTSSFRTIIPRVRPLNTHHRDLDLDQVWRVVAHE